MSTSLTPPGTPETRPAAELPQAADLLSGDYDRRSPDGLAEPPGTLAQRDGQRAAPAAGDQDRVDGSVTPPGGDRAETEMPGAGGPVTDQPLGGALQPAPPGAPDPTPEAPAPEPPPAPPPTPVADAAGAGANVAVVVAGKDATTPAQTPAAPGCFEVVRYPDADRKRMGLAPGAFYLILDGKTTAAACPAEQAALAFEVNRVLEALRTLAAKCADDETNAAMREATVAIYYARLDRIAQIGLTTAPAAIGTSVAPARPDLAARQLADLKEEVVRQEAPRVKSYYMVWLGKIAAWWAVPSLLVAALAQMVERNQAGIAKAVPWWPFLQPGSSGLLTFEQTVCGALLLASAAFGAWLSFGVRFEDFQFRNLLVLEEDYLGPKTRILFAVALTLVVALFFASGVVSFKVGDVSTADVFTKPVVAVVLGLVCGFSEKAVSRLIANTAGQFFRDGSDKPTDSSQPGSTTINVTNVKADSTSGGAADDGEGGGKGGDGALGAGGVKGAAGQGTTDPSVPPPILDTPVA